MFRHWVVIGKAEFAQTGASGGGRKVLGPPGGVVAERSVYVVISKKFCRRCHFQDFATRDEFVTNRSLSFDGASRSFVNEPLICTIRPG